MENTTFCQSCGMPLTEEKLHGKNKDESISKDYCCYCFPNGEFNNPDETLEQMIESVIPFMIESGDFPDEESARKVCQEHMPHLKRWKTS